MAAYEVLLLNTAIPQIQAAQTGDTYVVPRAIAFNSGVNVVNNDVTIYGLTVGRGAGAVSTNTAVGASALAGTNTGGFTTALGYQAGFSNTSGQNTLVGANSGQYITTGTRNTGTGVSTLGFNNGAVSITSNDNTAYGHAALTVLTSGASNTAVGSGSLQNNTTASNNTAVGYQAGYNNQTGASNSIFGQNAGYTNQTGSSNTIIGRDAGSSLTTSSNTLIGAGAGSDISSGSKNTVLGRYNGNQGGLDIRGASNYIVLSDGDGNPREYISNLGTAVFTVDRTSSTNATSILLRDNVTGSQTNGVYKSIRSESNAGSSVSEIRFIETDGSNNNTAIAFATADTAGGLSEKVRVLNTGAILAFSGATTNATGTGVGFPSTQSASTDPNVLDDYEEGTWTPAIRGSGTAGTYELATAEGGYIKIGKQVTLFARVVFAGSITGGGTGYMQITGAPSFNNARVSCGTVKQSGLDLSAGYTWLTVGHIGVGTTILYFDENGDAVTSNDFPISGVSAGDNFCITLTYEASA